MAIKLILQLVTYLKPGLEHILICVLRAVLLSDNVVPLLRKYFVSERFRFTIEEKLDSDGVVFGICNF